MRRPRQEASLPTGVPCQLNRGPIRLSGRGDDLQTGAVRLDAGRAIGARIALVHAVAFKRRLSPAWLLLFYLLLLVPPLSQGVMALGVVDAWADFRHRVRPRVDPR